MNSTQLLDFNGMSCVQLKSAGYCALVAYEAGSNVIRLRDDKNGIEFFRFKDSNTADDIKNSPRVWGLPTLYLPNRFADGVLKASDAMYHLPVNEKLRLITISTAFCTNVSISSLNTASTKTAHGSKLSTCTTKMTSSLSSCRLNS